MKPIRLMVGLIILQEMYGVSDESVVANWIENPYWQYFCGEIYFQHKFPSSSTMLPTFRKRIGTEGLDLILQESVRLGLSSGIISSKDCKEVIVDSTVQEKAITFPTDSKLYNKAREKLVELCKAEEVNLRQNYNKVSKHALFMRNMLSRCRKLKQAKKKEKKLKVYLGRVIRDIERKISDDQRLQQIFSKPLEKAKKIYNQQRKDKNKIYSWHSPEVECIGKGKAHKKYEFGCKVSIVATLKNNFVLGSKAFHDNPYDGHTLSQSIEYSEKISGIKTSKVFLDKGYRGNNYEDKK